MTATFKFTFECVYRASKDNLRSCTLTVFGESKPKAIEKVNQAWGAYRKFESLDLVNVEETVGIYEPLDSRMSLDTIAREHGFSKF
jgi:hypothetical protein